MAVEILYQGKKAAEWRYFHCGMCGTVWRDSCDLNGATYIIMPCPTCGISCADISREEALGYVPTDLQQREKQKEELEKTNLRQAVTEISNRFSDKYCCSTRDINKED